jgi:hypothetical protein
MGGQALADQIVGLHEQKWWIHELELINRLGVKATKDSTCWELVKAAIVLAKAAGASIEVQPFGAKEEIDSITRTPNWTFIGKNKLKIKLADQLRMVKTAIGEDKKNRNESDADRLRRANSWQSFYVDAPTANHRRTASPDESVAVAEVLLPNHSQPYYSRTS